MWAQPTAECWPSRPWHMSPSAAHRARRALVAVAARPAQQGLSRGGQQRPRCSAPAHIAICSGRRRCGTHTPPGVIFGRCAGPRPQRARRGRQSRAHYAARREADRSRWRKLSNSARAACLNCMRSGDAKQGVTLAEIGAISDWWAGGENQGTSTKLTTHRRMHRSPSLSKGNPVALTQLQPGTPSLQPLNLGLRLEGNAAKSLSRQHW